MRFIAYVDPGTGLLAWQAVVAAFVGTFFYVKKTRDWFVKGLRSVFRWRKAEDKKSIALNAAAADGAEGPVAR